MSDIAIQINNISKRYRIGAAPGRGRGNTTIGGSIARLATKPIRNFRRLRGLSRFDGEGRNGSDVMWALRDVSLDVEEGEVLGVIGANGAGKTTLLKILSRITEPTRGTADIYGRVGSLLEVGAGFHRELTGRENVYLNGAALGMTRHEIARKFDEIVEFAGMERFIDTPRKRYSIGMGMRLAFSVAAHLDPEILLVDEILAVGDVSFQNKCLGKINDVAQQGRTILFVSHNMGTIARLCTRAIWIDNGEIKLSGSPSDVIQAYLAAGASSGSSWSHSSNDCDNCNNSKVNLTSARVLTSEHLEAAVVPFDSPFTIEVGYQVLEAVTDTAVLIELTDARGNVVWTSMDTDNNDWDGREREAGQYISLCTIPGDILRPGRYRLTLAQATKRGTSKGGVSVLNKKIDPHEYILAFDVSQVGFNMDMDRAGIIAPALQWDITHVKGNSPNGLAHSAKTESIR